MADMEYNAQKESSPGETSLPLAHFLRYGLSRLQCRVNPIGKQSERLGLWLELEVFPAAKTAQHETIHLEIRPEGVIHLQLENFLLTNTKFLL